MGLILMTFYLPELTTHLNPTNEADLGFWCGVIYDRLH
jgi:hypothetical protein